MRGLSRLAALLEAFLFVKGDPVTMEELVSTLGENPDEIEKALALLKERYGKDDSGITLHKRGQAGLLQRRRNMMHGSQKRWGSRRLCQERRWKLLRSLP